MRAVSVVLLNAYSKGAKRALTAFLVCEKGDEGAPMWTCPMGGRKFEPVAAQAAAELDEELHLQVWGATAWDEVPNQLAMVQLVLDGATA